LVPHSTSSQKKTRNGWSLFAFFIFFLLGLIMLLDFFKLGNSIFGSWVYAVGSVFLIYSGLFAADFKNKLGPELLKGAGEFLAIGVFGAFVVIAGPSESLGSTPLFVGIVRSIPLLLLLPSFYLYWRADKLRF